MPKANQIVDVDRYSHQYAFYHLHDEGDLREFVFLAPKWASRASIENAFSRYGRMWIDRERDWQIVPRSIVCHGPYPCLDLEYLDYDVYVITARWRRVKPLVVKGDVAETLVSVLPRKPDVASGFREMKRHPELIEANARANAEAAKKVDKTLAAREEMDRWRRERGMPEFRAEWAEQPCCSDHAEGAKHEHIDNDS